MANNLISIIKAFGCGNEFKKHKLLSTKNFKIFKSEINYKT